MSEHDTVPAAEIDSAASATPLSDIIGSDRHQTVSEHVVEVEAGAPTPEPAPAPSAQPAPKAEIAAPAPAPGGDQQTQQPQGPRWFRDEMAKKERENARLRAENERLAPGRPAQQPQPRPTPPEIELPNPTEDPVGYAHAVLAIQRQELAQERQQRTQFEYQTRLNTSERFARKEFGNDLFDETFAWLETRHDLQDVFSRQPDPWGAAISHYQRERIAEEIGDDPNAWRERERERIRAEIQSELADRDQHQPAPQRGSMARTPPPPPASTVRNAVDRDDRGRFTGPTPMSAILNRQKA